MPTQQQLKEREAAIREWQDGRDEMLRETAQTGSSPWFADSLIRPANLLLHLRLKQTEPTFTGEKSDEYDRLQQAYKEREQFNQKQNERGATSSPWLMQDRRPPR